MDWGHTGQVVGVFSAVLVGVQAMLKAYQILRAVIRRASNPAQPQLPPGITIMNGEAKQLFAAIGRIEQRQDHQGRQLEVAVQRISNLEQRLST